MVFKHTQPELYLGKTNICTKQQERNYVDDITLYTPLSKFHLLCWSEFYSWTFFLNLQW